MTVGEKIKQIRISKGLKQSELAGKAGVSRVAIGNYERNDRQPGIDQVEGIAKALGISPIDLMGWKYWDATHPETIQQLREAASFESYLSKLGYSTSYEGKPGNPHMEEQVDDSGKIIGYAQIDEEETLESVTISKGKKSAVFNAAEFDDLQAKYLELQKKIAELEADYQDIIEMRIQKKADAKKKK